MREEASTSATSADDPADSVVSAAPATTSRVTGLDDWYDGATGVPGPAFWDAVVVAEAARAARFHRPATIVLVEAAGFEAARRQWGRSAAIADVAAIGAVLRTGCRASDYVVRLADERFGILLTETDEIAAINVVERLRARCEREVEAASTIGTRVAFGWASPTGKERLPAAIERAEERLRREVAAAGAG